MNKKGVIFVTISMTGGGTERVIATLANYWINKGFKVTILMIGGDDIAYDLEPKIDVRCVSGATAGDVHARMGRIRAMRASFKEDQNADIIAMGTVASIFASLASVGLRNRLIVSERNDPNRLNHRPIKGYERLIRNILYSHAERIVFQTEMVKEFFPAHLVRKSAVIFNPITDSLPEPKRFIYRKKTVISAGRLTEQKNHKLLIEAFKIFHDDHDDYDLEIYGEGECRDELIRQIHDVGADDYIFLKGFSSNIHEVMNDSMIYVSSSDWEGISNSLMESMAMGMAVIATDCPLGGSAVLIENEVNGLLIAPNDVKELVIALDRFADEEMSGRCSDQALKIKDMYSIQSIAGQWEELLND